MKRELQSRSKREADLRKRRRKAFTGEDQTKQALDMTSEEDFLF